jgi:hypothetical protein
MRLAVIMSIVALGLVAGAVVSVYATVGQPTNGSASIATRPSGKTLGAVASATAF